MVVESVMKDERLSAINPHFFDMMVQDRPILETLDEMDRRWNIEDFMQDGYDDCLAHEAEIREHIRRSER